MILENEVTLLLFDLVRAAVTLYVVGESTHLLLNLLWQLQDSRVPQPTAWVVLLGYGDTNQMKFGGVFTVWPHVSIISR